MGPVKNGSYSLWTAAVGPQWPTRYGGLPQQFACEKRLTYGHFGGGLDSESLESD